MIDTINTLEIIPLCGTDKQIVWARKIISSFQALANGSTLPTITSSTWWIEHRTDTLSQIRKAALDYQEVFDSPFTTRYPVKHKEQAIATLQALLSKKLIICDTETTGLGKGHEIINIALTNLQLQTILSLFVQPVKAKITQTAYKIHGISHDDLMECPTFNLVWPLIENELKDSIFLSYNGSFDASMIRRSLDACGLVAPHITCTCIMKLTQAFFELEDPMRLQEACERLDIDQSQYGESHGALADALTASHVLRELIDRSTP